MISTRYSGFSGGSTAIKFGDQFRVKIILDNADSVTHIYHIRDGEMSVSVRFLDNRVQAAV